MTVGYVLVSQMVHLWMSASSELSGSLNARLLVSAMVLLTIGMLVYLLHGERPPEFYQTGPSRLPRYPTPLTEPVCRDPKDDMMSKLTVSPSPPPLSPAPTESRDK